MSDRSAVLERSLEDEAREFIVARLSPDQAPPFLRLAFHDAGPVDLAAHSGGADGSIRLVEELDRAENAGWSTACVAVLAAAKDRFPRLSWADLIALGGAAAIERCGGPVIAVGIGRTDATVPDAEQRLPTGDADAPRLKAIFAAMGLEPRDLVVLSGGHTLGRNGGRPFTHDPHGFSNSYFRLLLAGDDDPEVSLLPSDRALLSDPDLRQYVALYAVDETAFLRDFAAAYRRLTWLGGTDPDADARALVADTAG